MDGVLSERRSDGTLFGNLHGCRPSASAQDNRQITRLLDSEAAGDGSPPAADPFLNHRRRVDSIVEHDTPPTLHVSRRDPFEAKRTPGAQNESALRRL